MVMCKFINSFIIRLSFICLMVAVFGYHARAQVTLKLYNTGVNADGTLMAPGSVDPHYTLIAEPGFTNVDPSYVTNPPNALWINTSPTSQWIAPVPNQTVWYNEYGYQPGFYDYQTTFDLTGLNPNSVVINGEASGDDGGWYILVNETIIGNFSGFNSMSQFSITNQTQSLSPGGPKYVQFNPGMNTIDFIVVNNPNYWNGNPGGPSPTGLNVQIHGTASLLTPELPSGLLLWIGLIPIGALSLFRRFSIPASLSSKVSSSQK